MTAPRPYPPPDSHDIQRLVKAVDGLTAMIEISAEALHKDLRALIATLRQGARPEKEPPE